MKYLQNRQMTKLSPGTVRDVNKQLMTAMFLKAIAKS